VRKAASVTFKKRGKVYLGTVPLAHLAVLHGDPAVAMSTAASLYGDAIASIKQWQRDIRRSNGQRTPLLARKAWEVGDVVVRLHQELAMLGCSLENPYSQFLRHTGISPSSLSRFVTLRRHVEDPTSIPEALKWDDVRDSIGATASTLTSKATRELQ